ncbi:alpha/beta hydrolase [Paenibacillus frigoriresistens]|uniref:alpha/beta hydrolase n=1 Tax=Paenibacillus alginolyticus TaxID=59839 RepID=UPI001565267E|nr:alpha/beta hydrolase [Paenibacillus frigoriresistens]NRF95613.1 alpha/beta hydrolase [Paenibacillus frigoriresistens]
MNKKGITLVATSLTFLLVAVGCGTLNSNGVKTSLANPTQLQIYNDSQSSQQPVKQNEIILEPAAQKFVETTANPPYPFDLGPIKAREALDKLQSGPVKKPPVDIQDLIIPGGPTGKVSIRIIKPKNAPKNLPVILYTHGGGWVLGNAHTHDRLIRELAVGSQSAVVFPNYSLSPEAKYPVALEEVYTVLDWVAKNGKKYGMNEKKITVAGDSVGGNISAAITLLAKDRKGPKIEKQLLFYPVTDAAFDTPSYHQFAAGYYLRRDTMQWFWDQYAPNPKQREEIYASPLRASIEQLKGLPKALIITDEADVLRDEGEAYANKLRQAGVLVTSVRFRGIIHDFVMLNDLAETESTRGAMLLSNAWLKQ